MPVTKACHYPALAAYGAPEGGVNLTGQSMVRQARRESGGQADHDPECFHPEPVEGWEKGIQYIAKDQRS
jgi:hypothetical protein